jgi:hypothetical protein
MQGDMNNVEQAGMNSVTKEKQIQNSAGYNDLPLGYNVSDTWQPPHETKRAEFQYKVSALQRMACTPICRVL